MAFIKSNLLSLLTVTAFFTNSDPFTIWFTGREGLMPSVEFAAV